MNAPDPDDQLWRLTFVRLLLCVLLLYYLATVVILTSVWPSHALMRDLAIPIALIACFGFAAVALTRLRGEAIIAIATGALLSIWVFVEALFHTTILTAIVRSSNWRLGGVVLIVLASCSLPAIAFFVIWPLHPRFPNAYADNDEHIEVSVVAPDDPTINPPE